MQTGGTYSRPTCSPGCGGAVVAPKLLSIVSSQEMQTKYEMDPELLKDTKRI